MSMHAKKSFFRSFLLKLAAIAVIAAIFFAGASIHDEVSKKNKIQSEINKLQQEADKISQENVKLGEKIAYLESREYQEREAKDKLNLQSPDESLVIIKPGVVKEINAETENSIAETPPATDEKIVSNYKKWWDYFFKY